MRPSLQISMEISNNSLKIKSHTFKIRDGSLFMGMTGSGKNRTGFENFSCRGDGLCVFFLNKETGL